MVPYIMKSIAYSGFFMGGIVPRLGLWKRKLGRSIKEMALGQCTNAAEGYAHLFLVSGHFQQVLADSLELLYHNSSKPSDLVVIWPGFEGHMDYQVRFNIFEQAYVLKPPSPSCIGPMVKTLSSAGHGVALLVINLGEWAEQQHGAAHISNIYGTIHYDAQAFGWPLVVVEEIEGISERNSAFLRRLFPRNTLI